MLRAEQRQSPSDAPRAVEGLELLRQLDPVAPVREFLDEVSSDRGYYHGLPVPLDGQQLILEPTFPEHLDLISTNRARDNDASLLFLRMKEEGYRLHNSFYSHKERGWINLYEKDGKFGWFPTYPINGAFRQLQTMDASAAWSIEAESKALQTLGSFLSHQEFKRYLLTGRFIERSRRSNLMYLFRKLLPTLVLSGNGSEEVGVRILCALCMHPIGYYFESTAGVMTPTDETLAHLMMMRTDEHFYWRKCNQHPAWSPHAFVNF